MRRAVPVLIAVAVLAVLVVGLSQASKQTKRTALPPFSLAAALKHLKGAPAPLAALHRQHSALLPGGTHAYKARLKALRGFPVVVNKWGSWCNPCRQEFPIFERTSTDLGKRVAFLGVNALDNAGEAKRFLRTKPLTYPSYVDPHGNVSQAAGAPGGAPITVFILPSGRTAFVHQGQYANASELRADVRRYLHA